ncbi:MAG: Fis family transcriptional regulator [Dehalococcoidia bacterium]|jgi:AmiR/NasT family two-component response regulator|nr:MAG: Fis family transcriptional regulator [Dehalococcoidia bacterium]
MTTRPRREGSSMALRQNLRIVIADDEALRLLSLRQQLEGMGHQVVGEATTGDEAVRLARELKPDLMIMDIRMPGMDGIDAAKAITAERPIPIVLVTAYSEKSLAERAAGAGIFAYLMKPVSEADLLPAIILATSRFEEFRELRKDIDDLREALEARKLIEQAKGILMNRRNLTEQEAFRRMQQQSQNENKKLVEIARAIIMADKML